MCRNIKTLFNFAPSVNDDEIQSAALQFVRKISGFNKPSKANEAFPDVLCHNHNQKGKVCGKKLDPDLYHSTSVKVLHSALTNLKSFQSTFHSISPFNK